MSPVDRADPSYRVRHSTAHVMAQAVMEMFPEARLGWGPPTDRFENGFYYDFDLPRALTPEDLPEIEARMPAIVADPSLLRTVAEGWTERNPTQPPVMELWLVQDETRLVEGRKGPTRHLELATWTVPR